MFSKNKIVEYVIVFAVVVLAGLIASGIHDRATVGGNFNPVVVDFAKGISVNGTQVIDSSRQFLGTFAGTTISGTTISGSTATFSGDATLSGGRLILATDTTQNCATNAVTINLATKTKGVVVADQVSGACAITLSNGAAGEMVVMKLVYGGDTAWTFATGGHYLGDTFDEADCDNFQATAVDGDELILTGVMSDADTIIPLSCYYADQS